VVGPADGTLLLEGFRFMNGPVFIVVGESSMRAVSADAIRYETFVAKNAHSLTHGFFLDGTCVVVGAARANTALAVWQTRNGTDWEHQELPAYPRAHGGFVMNGKVFVFIGIGDRGLGSVPGITWSADGKTWAKEISLGCPALNPKGGTGPIMKAAAVGPDRVVAVGDYGRRMVSTDGLEWKDADWHPKEPVKRLSLITIAYGNGLWVAGGLHGVRTTSSDGMEWSDPVAGLEGEHINNVFHDGERFVCVGQGASYFSADGGRWERVVNHDAPPLVIRAAGQYVGFKWPARMCVSKDSIHWEQVAELEHDAGGICHGELGG
jgi:hypothetical protein